jgi:hypothetical protein
VCNVRDKPSREVWNLPRQLSVPCVCWSSLSSSAECVSAEWHSQVVLALYRQCDGEAAATRHAAETRPFEHLNSAHEVLMAFLPLRHPGLGQGGDQLIQSSIRIQGQPNGRSIATISKVVPRSPGYNIRNPGRCIPVQESAFRSYRVDLI